MDDDFSVHLVVMLKSALEEIKQETEEANKNLEIAMAALYEIAYPNYFGAPEAWRLAREAIEKIEKK